MRLELHQVFNGVARKFSDPQSWVSEGGKTLKISVKMAILLVSSAVKNKFHHFWPPLEKRLEKSTTASLEKILPTPMHTSMSNYTIFVKMVLYYTIWQHCSTTPMRYKQAKAG